MGEPQPKAFFLLNIALRRFNSILALITTLLFITISISIIVVGRKRAVKSLANPRVKPVRLG